MAAVLVTGAAAGAAFQILFDTVIKGGLKMRKQYTRFRPSLQRLEDMLLNMEPHIKTIAAYNLDFDRPDELRVLKELLEQGDRLVHKCLTIHRFNFYGIAHHSKKIIKLEEMIRNHILCNLQIVQVADLKENLFATRMNSAVLSEQSKGLKKLIEQVSILSIASSVADGSSSKGGSLVGGCSPPGIKVKPVGLEIPLRDLKIKLIKDDQVSLIVVSAPGGCGKTTLATALCHDKDVKEKFKGNIFFVTVSKQPKILVIVEILFHHKDYMVREFHSEEDGVNQLEQLFRQMEPDPILLVLDDVWSGSDYLIERLKFGIENFKILVTSRSEFPRFGSTYKLQKFNFTDAMALFRQSALDGNSHTPDTETMTKIVQGCKGFPLAISVIGSSLRGKRRAEWQKRLEDCSKAASILSEYDQLLKCLQISVDALNDKVGLKECYMDLGSFPEDQRIPVSTLIDMWVELHNLKEVDAVINLYELADRNLIDLVVTRKDAAEDDDPYSEYFFKQHDLLRELAILQSNSDCIELRKRLFVDISGNSFPAWWMEQRELKAKLLSISTDEMCSRWESIEAPEVEVFVLNQSKTCTLPEFMGRMQKLKVLTVTNYGFFPAELSNGTVLGSSSNLKRIRFEKVSFSSIFLGSVRLEHLKKMSLVMCNIGEAFSSITVNIAETFPHLAEINIDYCKDLAELPYGFCDLSLLEKLSITNCHKLSALPDGIGRLVNLKELRLNSCIELSELPDTIGGLKMLKILDLSDCLSITELPEQIGQLSNLRTFYMIECSSCELPSSVINLVHLREVICDEETANAWRIYESYLSTLKIKEHKDINLDWLDNHCFF